MSNSAKAKFVSYTVERFEAKAVHNSATGAWGTVETWVPVYERLTDRAKADRLARAVEQTFDQKVRVAEISYGFVPNWAV